MAGILSSDSARGKQAPGRAIPACEGWLAITDPGCKLYPRPEEPGVKECYEGWDEILAYLVNWYSGWKEYTGEPERFIDAGDWVVVEINEVGIAGSGNGGAVPADVR